MRVFTVGTLRRSLSLFELVLAFLIICILAIVFLRYIDRYASLAELTRVQATVNTLRHGLNMTLYERIIRNDIDGISALDRANPFAIFFLDTNAEKKRYPVNSYLGELFHPDLQALETGNWYFDLARRELVYLPRHPGSFSPDSGESPALRFEARLLYEDRDTDGVYSQGDKLSGIRLVIPAHVKWSGGELY